MIAQVFINLPVWDLDRSVSFFQALGFTFNPALSDDMTKCLVLTENANVLLMTEDRFSGFTPKELAGAKNATEAIFALQVENKEQVEEMVQTAKRSGGTIYQRPQDRGGMYGHAFQDPDGHLWEVFCVTA